MTEKEKISPPVWVAWVFYLVLLTLFIPFFVMLASSFRSSEGLSFQWYRAVLSDQILWPAFLRSLAIAFLSSALATILGLLAAMSIIKWRPPSAKLTHLFATISLTLPELVLALALISWFGIWGIQLSLMTVVIAHVTLVLPFATLIISARLRSLDIAVEDAARDLGAKESEIFGLVLIPQIKTSLVNAFLLSFLMSFDDFLVSYFTNGAGQDTLPVLLYSQMKFGLSPVLTALSVLILLVSALICSLMLLLQKKDFK